MASGDLLLHDGSLGRIDLQKPIHASYQIRITSQQTVTIRLRQSGEGSPIPVDGDALQIEVDERPPARIALHWKSINRLSPRDLEALLRIDNTGGTSAVGLRMVVDVPGDVSVSTGDFGTERLDSGTSRTVAVRISSGGIPSGSVRFTLSHQSVGGESSETALALDLNRVIESDIDRLPIVGRSKAREEISRALFEDHSVLIDLHGSPGVGKRKLVRSALERATNAEGKQVEFYEIDCRMADSFAEAVFMLLNRLAFPFEASRGSDAAFSKFLSGAGMPENEYQGYVAQLRFLNPGQTPNMGTWYALSLLLSKLAKTRNLARLIIMLQNVSKFNGSELEGLWALRRYLQTPTEIRIVVTSLNPIVSEMVDRHIEVPALSDDDCRSLISAVFVLPAASATIESALIERSELLPANLISLLKQLTENADRLVDFDNPLRPASKTLPRSATCQRRRWKPTGKPSSGRASPIWPWPFSPQFGNRLAKTSFNWRSGCCPSWLPARFGTRSPNACGAAG